MSVSQVTNLYDWDEPEPDDSRLFLHAHADDEGHVVLTAAEAATAAIERTYVEKAERSPYASGYPIVLRIYSGRIDAMERLHAYLGAAIEDARRIRAELAAARVEADEQAQAVALMRGEQ